MVVLVLLVVPVAIGVFLLAMERLEFELIGTTPTADSDGVLLAQWSGGSPRSSDVYVGAVHLDVLDRAGEDDRGQLYIFEPTPGAVWPASSSTSRVPA